MGTWETIKGFFYVAVFGVAGYAVVVNDHDVIKVVTPVVLLICGWWFWKDMRGSFERWQRDRETRAMIVRQRLDRLEDRVADLESRLDDQLH